MLSPPLFAICSTFAAAAAVEVASLPAGVVSEIVIEPETAAEAARPFGQSVAVAECSVSFHLLALLDQYYQNGFDPV